MSITETEAPPLDDGYWSVLHEAFDEMEDIGAVPSAADLDPDDPRDEAWVAHMLRTIERLHAAIGGIEAKRLDHVHAATVKAAEYKAKQFDVLVRESAIRTQLVEEWAIERRRKTRIATFDYPAGTIKTTETAEVWAWPEKKDEIAGLVAAVEGAGRADLIRVKKEPKKDDIRAAALIKDGEAVLNGKPLGVKVGPEITARVVVS